MAKEAGLNKNLLIVLGIVVPLAIGANLWPMFKKWSRAKRIRRSRRVSAPSFNRRRVSRAAGGARGGRRILTPADIPVLSPETKRRLKALKGKKGGPYSEEEIRYQTLNPFLPLELTDREVERMLEEKRRNAAAKGGSSKAGGGVASSLPQTLYFRGICTLDGKRYAIIEIPDRKIPYTVQEGESFSKGRYILKNIADNGRLITVEDTKARRIRDRLLTIPYSGVDTLVSLGIVKEPLAEGTGLGGSAKGGPGGGKAAGGGSQKPQVHKGGTR